MSEYINKIYKDIEGQGLLSEIDLHDERIAEVTGADYDKVLYVTDEGKINAKMLQYLSLSGGTMNGAINMNNNQINGMAQGTSDSDAITKKQLEEAIESLGTTFNLKGTLPSVEDLPTSGNTQGDVWYIDSTSTAYLWLLGNITGTIAAGSTQISITVSRTAEKVQVYTMTAKDAVTQETVACTYTITGNVVTVSIATARENATTIAGTGGWWSQFGSTIDLTPYLKKSELVGDTGGSQWTAMTQQATSSYIVALSNGLETKITNPTTKETNQFLKYIVTEGVGSWVASDLPDTGVVDIDPKDNSIEIDKGTASEPAIGVKISSVSNNKLSLNNTSGQEGLQVVGGTSMDRDYLVGAIKDSPTSSALTSSQQVVAYVGENKIYVGSTAPSSTDIEFWYDTTDELLKHRRTQATSIYNTTATIGIETATCNYTTFNAGIQALSLGYVVKYGRFVNSASDQWVLTVTSENDVDQVISGYVTDTNLSTIYGITFTGTPVVGDTIKIVTQGWDVVGGKVLGVKGNSESAYRVGNINLTSANIGAIENPATKTDGDYLRYDGTNQVWEATPIDLGDIVGETLVIRTSEATIVEEEETLYLG